MKTLLNIGVLLVSLSAFASSNDPEIYQYWLDNNQPARFLNTNTYDSDPLNIDVNGLSEGAHKLSFRLADKDRHWGRVVSNMFMIPTAPDLSNNTPVAYRIFLNNEIVEQNQIPSGSPIELNPTFPEDIVLNTIESRSFKYLAGEHKMHMTINGKFSYAVQLMSDQKEWGAPFYKEISNQVTTKLPVDSIDVPGDYVFDKVNNNNFKAYKFKYNYNNDSFCIRASQDCSVDLYRIDEGYESKLAHHGTYRLTKGSTVRLAGWNNTDMVAVFYDTQIDRDNPEDKVSVRFMLEENKAPTPEILLDHDTWEVTMKCADKRATIFYTLDGSDPTNSSPVYTGPFTLDRFTRIKAVAAYGDLEVSGVKDMQFADTHLQIPEPQLKYVGGAGMNEFTFTNRVEGVTTYYRFDNESFDDSVGLYTFDGKPFVIEDGAYIKAYCVKDQLANSSVLSQNVYYRDYITATPGLNERRTEGEDHEYYSDRKEFVKLSVPEGNAYYRFVAGKQDSSSNVEVVEGQWSPYNIEVNDGWIELPGGVYSGNQTLQVYAETEGKARSAVGNIFTDWVQAKKPKFEYNNYQLKLSTDMPDGVIKYNFDYYNDDSAMIYVTDTLPDGLNVKERWLVSARVEAPGYSPSEVIQINRDNYNINAPQIQYQEDGYLHVFVDDEEATVVVTLDPQQSVEQISKNHVRFIPEYNTLVKAYASKWGYNNSSESERGPIEKPTVNIDGYRVSMSHPYYGAEIFYTINGQKPIREVNDSNFYYKGDFEIANAAQIRAVAFMDNEIPAEADLAHVLDQTEMPQIVFNYSPDRKEDGSLEKKKVKFTCATQNAKIWYSLDRTLSDNSRELYDPSTDWDGIDVTGIDYIYAYAEADGYRRSEQISRNTNEGYLSAPNIRIEDGVLEISHSDKTVEIKPAFRVESQDYPYNPEDLVVTKDSVTNKITCSVRYNTTVTAHVEKQGYVSSDDAMMQPISKPVIHVDGNRVWIDYSWDEIYYTLDGSMPTKDSQRYEGEFTTPACTVRAVKFEYNGIPSEADPVRVLDRAEAPKFTFNYQMVADTQDSDSGDVPDNIEGEEDASGSDSGEGSSSDNNVQLKESKRIQISSATPNAKIWYCFDSNFDSESKKEYDPNVWEGVDVGDNPYLYAYVEAKDYRDSEVVMIETNRGYLSSPIIEVIDSVVHIRHDDKTVKIVPTFRVDSLQWNYTPEDFEYVTNEETNEVTCTVKYNTIVTAKVEKWGYFSSGDRVFNPIEKPSINVNGYWVWFDPSWAEIYYTLDGTMPTMQSTRYDGNSFETPAGVVRAVRFENGQIPSEADQAKVMDMAESPEVTFNFDRSKTQKKVYLSSATPNAKIYYSLDQSLNEDTRTEYKPSEIPEGIDVTDKSYLYTYAEADGFRRSAEMTVNLNEGCLSVPDIRVKNYGEIEIYHDDPSLTIVPTFLVGEDAYTPDDYVYTHDEESNIITATVKPNTVVRAHTSKSGYYDSDDNERRPNITPTINVDGYYVWIDYNSGEVFYTLDGSQPTKESKYYENGFDATPCTVRAVRYSEGEIPSEATPAKVMDRAQNPVPVFNYSTQMVEGEEGSDPEEVVVKKMKFTCATPNSKIYYSRGRSINDDTRALYNPETDSDGIDVSDYSNVYAYAEAEGYRRSETVTISTSAGYLSAPNLEVTDGVVEIWHDDPTVTIVPEFTPAQQYEYVKNDTVNKVTCKVLYNTTVKAHVEKAGCFSSSEVTRVSLDKPTVRIEGNNVYIDHYWRDEVYYTLDGSTPTKQSQRFEDNWFTVDPCTVKAVAFRDGEIPAEGDPATVLPQTVKPVVTYNFDRSKDQKKIKFSCDTPNAKIYYALNTGITDSNRKLYEASSDGVDVTDISYVYFYAEADGFRRSEEINQNIQDAYLGTPDMQVTGDGVVEIWHNDPTVKIVPEFIVGTETYVPEDLTKDPESNKVTATVKYNTVVRAHVEKDGYYASDDNERQPLPQPIINVDGYYVWFDNNYYGDVFYTLDGSQPTKESKYYEGGFDAPAGIVRAVCFSDGNIPSEATPASVKDQLPTPKVVFNFSKKEVDGEVKDIRKIKFSCDIPDARIYYSADRPLNSDTRIVYDPVANPDGIDVSEINYVYTYAEAEGYRNSDVSERVYMSEGLLNAPEINIANGVVTISHRDPTVTIVPTITPAQEYSYVHDDNTNRITFNVAYNSTVKAYATKSGHLDSESVSAGSVDKPVIRVSDYYVEIDTHGYDYYTYYTTDGTMPTAESIPYSGGFESNACTIRAATLIDGLIPMEADPAKVMDPAAAPVVEIDNGFAKLTTSTSGATIYYSADISINNSTRKVYDASANPNGINLKDVKILYTYAEADGFRRSETVNFVKNEYVLAAPTITYSQGYVTAIDVDEDVTVKFTDGNGKELTPDANNARRVKVDYNTTVNAYSYKKGYINSSSVQIKSTDAPTISAELFTVTIKSKTGQTVRYTTDGSIPTNHSKLYSAPFSVTESCKVRAVAFADALIPAEGTPVDITYRKSLKPEVKSYDGRYLTLSAENGSSIIYAVGDNADPTKGTVVNDKIDLEGLNVIKAIAQRSDADDSEVFTFTPDYYANETDVYTSKEGVLSKAFDWCADKSIYSTLKVHGVILGSETEDNGGYEFLKSLPSLRHLDLANVTDGAVPDSAFASKKLLSVVLPASLKTAGNGIFGDDNKTLCSIELPGDGFAPVNLLEGVKNPNLLLYVKNKNLVTDLLAQAGDVVKNVVVLGSHNGINRAENVVLTHANAFYSPKEFTAQKISFTRSFTKETQIGGFGSGWETMVVPFDVQSVSCASKVCKPFGEADTEKGECPFWLFSGADTDWQAETSMFANTPYLLAFPNNAQYADEYVVNGDVVFSSSNVNVPTTPVEEDMMSGFGLSRYLVGNYAFISKEEDVLAVNDEIYSYHNNVFQPGGIFVANQKDVVPFECFIWSDSGESRIPVFDQSDIDVIMNDTGVKIWSESYDIYIHSGLPMRARIYDSVGQMIRSVEVKAGETVRVRDITPGIYFVGNTKILVKK